MTNFKKLFIRFLVILLAVQGAVAAQLLTLQPVKAAAVPSVVINEVMWMGSSESSSDEWIELYNSGLNPVDVGGWILTNAATGGNNLIIPSGTVPAGGFFLISNFAETSANSVLNIAPDYVTSSVSIGNSCQPINLIRLDLGAGAALVDSMGCDGANYFGGSNGAVKTALERNLIVESGLDQSSWHNSVGFANLDAVASGNDLATPKFVNDTTPATIGSVDDDGDFTADTSQLHAAWSGFADAESGINGYSAGVGTAAGLNDVVTQTDVGLVTDYTFSSLSLVENTTYYINVTAKNGVGLLSAAASSNGITVNTVAPDVPTNLTAIDAPDDNGGSLDVSWDASASPDVSSYQVNFRKQGDLVWSSVNVGLQLTETITGLENAPVIYEITVEAIDFSNQHSAASPIVSESAIDNLAPILDVSKVVVGQNSPGSNDTVAGLSGASNENPATVSIFKRFPIVDADDLITTVATNPDGSFPAVSLGDNELAEIWLQLADSAGNTGVVRNVSNDIIAPNAPELQKLTAECKTLSCRVELRWQDRGPDTVRYQVGYTPNGGGQQRTLDLTSSGVAMDLEPGRTIDFAVFAYDAASNQSAASNILRVTLVSGVLTTVIWQNGDQVTTTESIGGTKETIVAPINQLQPSVIAEASDGQPAKPQTSETNFVDTAGEQARTGDWVRILIVVVLLLIVAGGFYALSRSFNESEDVLNDKPIAGGTKRRPKRRSSRR